MAKKETSTKKTTTKAKKTTEKKIRVSKKVNTENVTVEEKPVEVETKPVPEDDKELMMDVMKHVASEILADNGNNAESLNEMPQDEVVEKVKEKIDDIKKINSDKVNKRIDNVFGYLWNGQEVDW